MAKKDEVKKTKKAKAEVTEEIVNEISDEVKKDITEEIVNDIKKSFDQEYKDELKGVIRTELIDDIKKDISKDIRKQSRSKSFKIFRLYIYLLIVVAALVYILFRLYETDNLTIIDEAYTRRPTSVSERDKSTTTTTEALKDGVFYVSNYSYLMDNIKISNVELVKDTTNVSDIGDSEKLALAYAALNEDEISVDGIIRTIGEESLLASYERIFGSTDGYTQTNFIVNGLNYAYSSLNNSYMAIGEEDTTQSYVNNILVDGYEEDGVITLVAKAYVIKNGSIYNPNNMNYRISEYSDDLTKVQNRLLSVEYKFKKNDGGYNLVSISRK